MECNVSGLIAATFTPFKDNGEVDYDKIDEYVDFLVDNGVKNIFPNGTTGEGSSLTTSERKLLAEKWIAAGRNKLDNIIVHVGGANLHESMELAEHAQSVGAQAIGLVGPTYFKPQSIGDLVEYCRQVASKAPSKPFFYYHIPSMTSIRLNMEEFVRAAEPVIPTLAGLKFSDLDLTDGSRCLNYKGGKYKMFYGCDQQLLCALTLGFDSAIGSTYNYMAPLYFRMMESYKNGDVTAARRDQFRSQDLVTEAQKFGSGNSVWKEVMRLVGCDLGPLRCPLTTLTPDKRELLRKRLAQIGFFDWRK